MNEMKSRLCSRIWIASAPVFGGVGTAPYRIAPVSG